MLPGKRDPATLAVGTYLQRTPERIDSYQLGLRCHRAVGETARGSFGPGTRPGTLFAYGIWAIMRTPDT